MSTPRILQLLSICVTLLVMGCDQQKDSFVTECKKANNENGCGCIYDVAKSSLSDELLDIFLLTALGKSNEATSKLGKLSFLKQASFAARSAQLLYETNQKCNMSN